MVTVSLRKLLVIFLTLVSLRQMLPQLRKWHLVGEAPPVRAVVPQEVNGWMRMLWRSMFMSTLFMLMFDWVLHPPSRGAVPVFLITHALLATCVGLAALSMRLLPNSLPHIRRPRPVCSIAG
jgi:hypothetical protein